MRQSYDSQRMASKELATVFQNTLSADLILIFRRSVFTLRRRQRTMVIAVRADSNLLSTLARCRTSSFPLAKKVRKKRSASFIVEPALMDRKFLSITVLLWRHWDHIQSILPILSRLGRKEISECCYGSVLVTVGWRENLVSGLSGATVLRLCRVSVRNIV
jgi:hypothetical protein